MTKYEQKKQHEQQMAAWERVTEVVAQVRTDQLVQFTTMVQQYHVDKWSQ